MCYNNNICPYCAVSANKKHIIKCIYNPINLNKLNEIIELKPLTKRELIKLLNKKLIYINWVNENKKIKTNKWYNIFISILFDIELKYPNKLNFELIDYYFIRLFQKYNYYPLHIYNERIKHIQDILDITVPKENEDIFFINVALHNKNDKDFINSFAPEILVKNKYEFYRQLNIN